jgi:Protein of unknown function (DUF3592)
VSEHPLGATIAGVVLFIAGMSIAGGIYQINEKERELRRGWLRADGTVVEVLKRQTADGQLFFPLIAFQTASGARVSFTARQGEETPQFAIGDKVPVRYAPALPGTAEIDYRQRRLVRNLIAGLAAAVLILLGATVAWQASRLQRARSGS